MLLRELADGTDTHTDGTSPPRPADANEGGKKTKKLRARYRREKELEAYQVELLKLQAHLEATGRKMIVIFEGSTRCCSARTRTQHRGR